MKLRFYIIAGLLALATGLQSCEKDVANFDINSTPVLVTTAFISPQDTALAVELRWTQPAIGKHLNEEQLKVKDATVTISDGAQQVQLQYDAALNKYLAPATSLPIMAGKAYFLKVSTPSGARSEAECVVPVLTGVRITELNYETSASEWYGSSLLDHKINFKWQDAPGVENYYHVLGYRSYQVVVGFPAELSRQHESMYADNSKIFVSDVKQDGQIMQSTDFTMISQNPDHAPRPFMVIALLAATDKAYFEYHQSLRRQEHNSGNPFAEPSRIYSNMRGGIGVFAAYNQIKVYKVIQ